MLATVSTPVSPTQTREEYSSRAGEDGCDSDGERHDATADCDETVDCGEEEPIGDGALAPPPNVTQTQLDKDAIQKMSVADLKDAIKARRSATKNPATGKVGNKAWLQEKLESIKDAPLVDAVGNADAASPAWNTGTWMVQPADEDVVADPAPPPGFHPPTLPEGEQLPSKRNHSSMNIDRSARTFTGDENTRPNPDFIKEHNLDEQSHPAEHFHAFMPAKAPRNSQKRRGGDQGFSFEKMASWTNTKALMFNFGDTVYPNWKPTSTKEIIKLIGTWMFVGLNPSPQQTMIFKTQKQDPVNGNDFLASAWYPNGDRRYKELKAALAVQDPILPVPPKATHPNHKVAPLLVHLEAVCRAAVIPGKSASGDEQAEGFQGRSAFKIKIKFKDEVRDTRCCCVVCRLCMLLHA